MRLTTPAGAGQQQSRSVSTFRILLVEAGVAGTAAIRELRTGGAQVVAVAGDVDAVAVDLADVRGIAAIGAGWPAQGVMTVASDRAVPIVAEVAELLGLPGIGRRTAHLMGDRIALRRRLEISGVPQPDFAVPPDISAAFGAADRLGFPLVVKPVESNPCDTLRVERGADLAGAFAAAGVAGDGPVLMEQCVTGLELDIVLVARGGRPSPIAASERLRAPAERGGCWAHVFPARIPADVLSDAARVTADAVRSCGLVDGVAFSRLAFGDDGRARVLELTPRVPASQMRSLIRFGTGIDLLEIAVYQALGRPVPDTLIEPSFMRPAAIRFTTGAVPAAPDLRFALAAPGVLDAGTTYEAAFGLAPVASGADHRAYVVATGESPDEALTRASAGADLVRVEAQT